MGSPGYEATHECLAGSHDHFHTAGLWWETGYLASYLYRPFSFELRRRKGLVHITRACTSFSMAGSCVSIVTLSKVTHIRSYSHHHEQEPYIYISLKHSCTTMKSHANRLATTTTTAATGLKLVQSRNTSWWTNVIETSLLRWISNGGALVSFPDKNSSQLAQFELQKEWDYSPAEPLWSKSWMFVKH